MKPTHINFTIELMEAILARFLLGSDTAINSGNTQTSRTPEVVHRAEQNLDSQKVKRQLGIVWSFLVCTSSADRFLFNDERRRTVMRTIFITIVGLVAITASSVSAAHYSFDEKDQTVTESSGDRFKGFLGTDGTLESVVLTRINCTHTATLVVNIGDDKPKTKTVIDEWSELAVTRTAKIGGTIPANGEIALTDFSTMTSNARSTPVELGRQRVGLNLDSPMDDVRINDRIPSEIKIEKWQPTVVAVGAS